MKRPNRRRRDRGVAMLIVLTWLALMISVVSEFTYGTNVESAQAANARDELRAHYLARSSVNLSRLLIKIQQEFVDPIMGTAQKMIAQAMGTGSSGTAGGASGAPAGLGFSIRVTDYAGMLMGFFSGSKEEVAGLGSMFGLNTANAKGLGLAPHAGKFDAEITAEDAKIDVNCGSGLVSSKENQLKVYRLLMGMLSSPRFDRLFSEADTNGQFVTRPEVARAIIDWADGDDQMFTPDNSGGAEDYRYDARADHYRAHDNSYDTIEELKQVRGVSDGFMEAFQPYLTVYVYNTDCRLNLRALSNKNGGDCTPLLMGLIRAAAQPDPNKPPTDPAVLDDTRIYPMATVLCERATAAGFDSIDTITNLMAKPQTAVLPDDPRYKIFQSMPGINVNKGEIGKLAYVDSPRMYRITATGEVGKVKKKITAIVDSKRAIENPQTTNPAAEKAAGVLQYWREE
jgi:general secretion pathway protein K